MRVILKLNPNPIIALRPSMMMPMSRYSTLHRPKHLEADTRGANANGEPHALVTCIMWVTQMQIRARPGAQLACATQMGAVKRRQGAWGGSACCTAPEKAMGRLMPCSAIQSISASQRSQLHHVME